MYLSERTVLALIVFAYLKVVPLAFLTTNGTETNGMVPPVDGTKIVPSTVTPVIFHTIDFDTVYKKPIRLFLFINPFSHCTINVVALTVIHVND